MKSEITVGDCREIMAGMDAESVDMVVTSPPYDDLRTYGGGVKWDRSVWEEVISQMYRAIKPGGVAVWIVNDATVNGSETGTSFSQALYAREVGFRIHDTMIWDKGNFTATGSLAVRYAPVFEYMFVFSKGKPSTFAPIKDKPNKGAGELIHGAVRQKDGSMKPVAGQGIKRYSEFGQRHNVWKIPPAVSSKDRVGHPAPMPVSLAHDFIITWSKPGDVVLDPFAGGGTTGVACVNSGRRFIGIELNPEYAAIARARIDAIPLNQRGDCEMLFGREGGA